MMGWIKSNGRFLVWFAAYALFAFMAYEVTMLRQERCFHGFLEANLFSLDRYSFSILNFFIPYLYLMKRPFESVFFVARCKESHLLHMVFYGLKICLLYIGITMFFFLGIPFLDGFRLTFEIYLILNFLNLFSYLFTTYLLYVMILLLSRKQMLAILGSMAINWVLMLTPAILNTINEELALRFISFLLTSYTLIAVIMLGIIYLVFRRRDMVI